MLQDPELLMMTNYYKQMCMCEACQSSTYMQSALDTFRRNHLSQLERDYKNYSALSSHEKDAKSILISQLTMYKIGAFNGNGDQHLYPTPSSTASATQYPSPDGFEDTGLTRIYCASSSCKDCGYYYRPAAENGCIILSHFKIEFLVVDLPQSCTTMAANNIKQFNTIGSDKLYQCSCSHLTY